jgi:hypothetical protein
MTKFSLLLTIVASSFLAAGCAAEEGYTPIGEDREDKGGGLFYLSADKPSGAVYFSCDDVIACDLQLNIALTASEPELDTMDGQEALHATLISPSGENNRAESMVIGKQDSIGIDASLVWSFTYAQILPGDYEIILDLGALDGANVRIGTIEL